VSVSEHQDGVGLSVFQEGALHMEVGASADSCAVRLRGELDIEVAPLVEAELMRLLREPRGSVTVDMSDLEYIDSIGLRCLVMAAREAEASNSRLVFRRPGGDVARILKLTRLDEALAFDE
jgi:anti-sigma B factor antagonist